MASPPFRENSILCPDSTGWHRLVYSDWGPKDGRPVLCVQYLTGNGRYFDWLARDLAAQGFRVIAPDMPGRGRSDNLKNPQDYVFRQYIGDLGALLAALGVNQPESVDWIGASMGGLLGIVIAAMPNSPVKRLTLVDVGPLLAAGEMKQMAAYIAKPPAFKTMPEFEMFMRNFRAPAWGRTPDGYWPEFARQNIRALPDGAFTLAYDPGIAAAFAGETSAGLDLWPTWDAVACPVLILRGEKSAILPQAVADEMTRRGPKARLEIIKGCGHVPSLAAPEQIALVRTWLE
jgi:pimeloyl-ACP methyl ester carboxylesterase